MQESGHAVHQIIVFSSMQGLSEIDKNAAETAHNVHVAGVVGEPMTWWWVLVALSGIDDVLLRRYISKSRTRPD